MLWATDFPWGQGHSPGSKSLFLINNLVPLASPTHAPPGCSPRLLTHLVFPRCSSLDFRARGSGCRRCRVPGGEPSIQGLWARPAGPAAGLPKAGEGGSAPRPQGVGATCRHPGGSDIRRTSLNLQQPLGCPPSGVWGSSGRGDPCLGTGVPSLAWERASQTTLPASPQLPGAAVNCRGLQLEAFRPGVPRWGQGS